MNFDIITIFPELIEPYFNGSMLKRAAEKGIIKLNLVQLRDYCEDKHRQVDDTVYGGGSGMLMKPDVLGKAVEDIKSRSKSPFVILMSPQGLTLDNKLARQISISGKDIIIVCGRYEGVDQRFIDLYVDMELSIGDYVLSGGELAAAITVEAVSRFIPGVVGREESVATDSFESSMLKYPQYTKPREYKGLTVPEVLLSGNHAEIAKWREEQAKLSTQKKRKDLLTDSGFTVK
jgi:tRNA (guanine37-N1)-methyltransferase